MFIKIVKTEFLQELYPKFTLRSIFDLVFYLYLHLWWFGIGKRVF